MNTVLNTEEREMIINALRTYESEFSSNTLSEESKAHFAKVLALADRLETESSHG